MSNKHIDFNVPISIGNEIKYIDEAIRSHHICGDGKFTKKCDHWMEDRFHAKRIMLTTSGTSALDMAVMCCGISSGDEVILPSFTFSSTANSVIMSGGTPVFIDVRPDTMNIDETLIEPAITDKTKAVMVVHYAGVSCEMDAIMDIAARHGLKVIEDAAQAMMSTYKGRYLGTIGDFGCYSFHETKNFSMGEGGAIVVNDSSFIGYAEILREKGTDRSRFYRGQVDKYTWVEKGDSFLPSELDAAYLYPQLLKADEITSRRVSILNRYREGLQDLVAMGRIDIQTIPDECSPNGHIFYIKCKDLSQRTDLITFLKDNNITAVFHYIPLHSAPAGRKYGRFSGDDVYTTADSERLLRLPMHYELTDDDIDRVVRCIHSYFMKDSDKEMNI